MVHKLLLLLLFLTDLCSSKHFAISKMETNEQLILKDLFSLLNVYYCSLIRQVVIHLIGLME